MIKRIVAIALIAALGVNVKVGMVVAMDTTTGYKVWESYEKVATTSQRYEEEKGSVMDGADSESYGHIEEVGKSEELLDEYGNPIGGAKEEQISPQKPQEPEKQEYLKENEKPENQENPGTEFPTEELEKDIDQSSENFGGSGPEKDDYFNGDNIYNNDFSFDDYFDYNPYNPGDFSPSAGNGSYEPQEEEEQKEPGDNFLKTGKTIHYAYGELSRYTKFIDTGIKLTSDESIEYEQISNLFKQISVEKGWKIVESTNEMLVLMNGEVIIIKGNVADESSLKKMFKDTDITISIEDTRAGGRFSIADHLEMHKSLDVVINGKEITLHAEPELVNSRAVLPVRSIGEGLGAVVRWNSSKKEAVIEKGSVKIRYSIDDSIVNINGDKYLLTEKTKLNDEKNRLLSVVSLLVNELDAKMYWDSVKGILVIESNETPEKINLDKNL